VSVGLQIRDASGNLTFDSLQAVGGVCLGFYSISAAGGSVSFPSITTMSGFAIPSGAGGPVTFTTDYSLGYLRFNFPAGYGGYNLVLFAK